MHLYNAAAEQTCPMHPLWGNEPPCQLCPVSPLSLLLCDSDMTAQAGLSQHLCGRFATLGPSQAKLCPTNRPISYPPVPLSHAADMKASSIGGIWSLSLANRRQAKGPTNMQNLSGPEPADASEIHHPLVTEQAITTHSWSSVLNDKFPPLAFLRSMTISMSIKQKMCQKKKSQSIICVNNFFCCQKFSCNSTFYLSNLKWKFSTWSVSSSLWHLSIRVLFLQHTDTNLCFSKSAVRGKGLLPAGCWNSLQPYSPYA